MVIYHKYWNHDLVGDFKWESFLIINYFHWFSYFLPIAILFSLSEGTDKNNAYCDLSFYSDNI